MDPGQPALGLDFARFAGQPAPQPRSPPSGRPPLAPHGFESEFTAVTVTALPRWPHFPGGNLPDCSQNRWSYFDASFGNTLRLLVREREYRPALAGSDYQVLL